MMQVLLDLAADRIVLARGDGRFVLRVERDGDDLMSVTFPESIVRASGSELVRERFPWLATLVTDRSI